MKASKRSSTSSTSTSTSGCRPLPASLIEAVEEARVAEGMESALRGSDQRLQALLLKKRAERAYAEQRSRKAGSYTLAERYGVLDVFAPTVTLTDTKIV